MGGGMGGYGGGMMGGGMMGGGMGGYGGGMMGGGMGGYGGGMMGGGMGGMGGYGGGMMGGGMGGYGGGMMGGGMGGMGGGMYGGMGGQGNIYQAQSLLQLIQETIEPDSWFELSDTGEGTIMVYPSQQPSKIAVMQTHEVHQEIEKLLEALRVSLGNQVAIEAVFLVVTENFLEDIGLDVDFSVNLGSKWGQLSFEQGSAIATTPDASTKIGGSLGGIEAAATVTGGYGSILDDLQASFLLRAVQAHTDSKAIVAPKNTVLSGESSAFSVTDIVTYALPPTTGTTTTGIGVGTGTVQQQTQQQVGYISVGSMLSITPTISHDKKYVLLNIVTTLTDLLRLRTHQVEQVVATDGTVETEQYEVTVPETETSSVMTRVSVPDGGTLLLGGQKITSEIEKEAGVPVLSKIPILGRLFSNRSTIRDQKILLILVKPVIMLQPEREAEAIAGMESEY
jgi:general secretion pathway protein D